MIELGIFTDTSFLTGFRVQKFCAASGKYSEKV